MTHSTVNYVVAIARDYKGGVSNPFGAIQALPQYKDVHIVSGDKDSASIVISTTPDVIGAVKESLRPYYHVESHIEAMRL